MDAVRKIIGLVLIVFFGLPILFGMIWAVGLIKATVSPEFLTDLPRQVIAEVPATGAQAQGLRLRLQRRPGIRDGIMHRAARNHPLTKKQIRKNRALAPIRSAVERPFAFMKRVLGYERCRYYDLARNRLQFMMAALVYNMRILMTAGTV